MKKFFDILNKTIFIIDQNDKLVFFTISFCTFLIALLEIFSISIFYLSIEFFLDQRNELPKVFKFVESFSFIKNIQDGKSLFIFFIAIYIFKIVLAILCTNFIYRFNFIQKFKISNFLSKVYLKKNFSEIFKQKDSFLISNLTDRISNSGTVLLNISLLISELFFLLSIILFLLILNIKITSLGILLILLISIIYNLLISKKVKNISFIRQKYNDRRLEVSNYLIKALKDIKILQREKLIFNYLKEASFKNFKTFNIIQLIQTYPRFIMEFVFILSIISFYIYVDIFLKNNFIEYIPVISIFIFSIFRIIPSFNKILFYINNTFFYYPSLNIIYQEKKSNKFFEKGDWNVSSKKIIFNKKLSLKRINFSYNKENTLFKNLNFDFYKNKSYAIVGPSGSGKSPLINILLGILKVNRGKVEIDGNNIENDLTSYLSSISYIPQEFIFLEESVKNVICFGAKYEQDKVLNLIKKLNIFKYKKNYQINKLLNSKVKQLSIGQKQKIAIVRALYQNANIIIFDEPTSALDKKSILELKKIMIKLKKNKTLIVVTHDIKFSKIFDKSIDLTKFN